MLPAGNTVPKSDIPPVSPVDASTKLPRQNRIVSFSGKTVCSQDPQCSGSVIFPRGQRDDLPVRGIVADHRRDGVSQPGNAAASHRKVGVSDLQESGPSDDYCHSSGQIYENINGSDLVNGLRNQPVIHDKSRDETDFYYGEIKNAVLMMRLINELRSQKKEGLDSGQVSADRDHKVIKELKCYFEKGKFSMEQVYEASFDVRKDGAGVHISIIPTSPVTQQTPKCWESSVSPFDEALTNDQELKKVDSAGWPVSIHFQPRMDLEKLCLENYHQDESVYSLNGSVNLKMLFRFRDRLPPDQEISNLAGYRLLAGDENQQQFYVSDTLQTSLSGNTHLFVEFQIPLVQQISPNIDEIVDVSKEYPSTFKKFKQNSGEVSSLDNSENRNLLQSETIPIVRNMEQATPETNAFADKFLGSGIAQKVSVHGVFPSVALKFLPKPMDEVEARIVMNTLNVTQTLTQLIMKSAPGNVDGKVKLSFSPIQYLSVVDPNAMGDDQSEGSLSDSDQENDNEEKYALRRQRGPRIASSNSECEAFDAVQTVAITDEVVESKPSSINKDETFIEGGISVRGKNIWVAGMQRRYDKQQMVEYILQDPDESPGVKIEIIKKILSAIDLFDSFNKKMAASGGESLVKCIIDGNFANFAFDKVSHCLIYLDVAPATLSINSQIVPGNQFMMNWFSSRQRFNYRLSTDPQMSKLFVLVMVTNQLRKLEERTVLYKSEGLRDDALDKRVRCLDQVVSNISSELAENKDFMRWCGGRFFSHEHQNESSKYLSNESERNEFSKYIQLQFKDYINSEQDEMKVGSWMYDIELSDRIEMLRLLSDAVAKCMVKIKQDALELSPKIRKRSRLISTGIKCQITLGANEVKKFVESILGREFACFVSETEACGDSFRDVVFAWLKNSSDDFIHQSVGNHEKNQLMTDLSACAEMGDHDLSDDKERVLTIPAFQNALFNKFNIKKDILLIEPFSGGDKNVASVLYKWDMEGDGEVVINYKEYFGVEVLNKLCSENAFNPIILVNRQVGRRYSMGDVNEHHWSSVVLKEGEREKGKLVEATLPIEYPQGTSGASKVIFETIVSSLNRLHLSRSSSESGHEQTDSTDLQFLKKVCEYLPSDCVKLKATDRVSVEMSISPSSMLSYKPLFRAYFDMLRDNPALEYNPTRLYIIVYFPEAGRYARWMFRASTSKDNQVLSYMNFRGPFSLSQLKNDVDKSNDSPSIDFIFFKGGYGYCSGLFQLYGMPEAEVGIGYNKELFDRVMRGHPQGGSPDVKETVIHNGHCEESTMHTDDIPSKVLNERIFT